LASPLIHFLHLRNHFFLSPGTIGFDSNDWCYCLLCCPPPDFFVFPFAPSFAAFLTMMQFLLEELKID
jgi:hypothetical protein